jgi:release factor glutamine methyltransferase
MAASATLATVLESATAALAAAGVDTPRVDAEWLLADLLPGGRRELVLSLDRRLDAALAERYEAAVRRRAAREPLQQICGSQDFLSVRVTVTPDVLVPRPETEVLVEWALGLLPPPRPGWRPRVVDVGTGSGCIACAIAHARPDARVLAIDLSPAAAGLARDNARRLGLAARVGVVVGDALAPVRAARGADLIVANPPYMPRDALGALPPEVIAHEPRLALDGGPDGLALVRRIVADAPRRLAHGGALVLETAGGAQVALTAARMEAAGLRDVATHRDLAGVERFVAAFAAGGAREPR